MVSQTSRPSRLPPLADDQLHLAFPNKITGSIAAGEPLASVTIPPGARLALSLVRVVITNPRKTGIRPAEKPNGEKGYEPSHKAKKIRADVTPMIHLAAPGRIFTPITR